MRLLFYFLLYCLSNILLVSNNTPTMLQLVLMDRIDCCHNLTNISVGFEDEGKFVVKMFPHSLVSNYTKI